MKKPFPIPGLCLLLFLALWMAHGAPQGRGTPSNAVPEQGKKVYHANCEECHGPQGRNLSISVVELSNHHEETEISEVWICR